MNPRAASSLYLYLHSTRINIRFYEVPLVLTARLLSESQDGRHAVLLGALRLLRSSLFALVRDRAEDGAEDEVDCVREVDAEVGRHEQKARGVRGGDHLELIR